MSGESAEGGQAEGQKVSSKEPVRVLSMGGDEVLLTLGGEKSDLFWRQPRPEEKGRFLNAPEDRQLGVTRDLNVPEETRLIINDSVFITGGEGVSIPAEYLQDLVDNPYSRYGNKVELQTKGWANWEKDRSHFEIGAGRARFIGKDGPITDISAREALDLLRESSGRPRMQESKQPEAESKPQQRESPKVEEVKSECDSAAAAYRNALEESGLDEEPFNNSRQGKELRLIRDLAEGRLGLIRAESRLKTSGEAFSEKDGSYVNARAGYDPFNSAERAFLEADSNWQRAKGTPEAESLFVERERRMFAKDKADRDFQSTLQGEKLWKEREEASRRVDEAKVATVEARQSLKLKLG